ncbi:MAG: hypothetical protein WA191_14425 [Telluria sp.]
MSVTSGNTIVSLSPSVVCLFVKMLQGLILFYESSSLADSYTGLIRELKVALSALAASTIRATDPTATPSASADLTSITFAYRERHNLELALESRISFIEGRLSRLSSGGDNFDFYTEQLAAAESALAKVVAA